MDCGGADRGEVTRGSDWLVFCIGIDICDGYIGLSREAYHAVGFQWERKPYQNCICRHGVVLHTPMPHLGVALALLAAWDVFDVRLQAK